MAVNIGLQLFFKLFYEMPISAAHCNPNSCPSCSDSFSGTGGITVIFAASNGKE
jgi:hypothetical protein